MRARIRGSQSPETVNHGTNFGIETWAEGDYCGPQTQTAHGEAVPEGRGSGRGQYKQPHCTQTARSRTRSKVGIRFSFDMVRWGGLQQTASALVPN